jgi:putative transposase
MVAPSARRRGVNHLAKHRFCSERRACKLIGISRSTARYAPANRPDEEFMIERIKKLAGRYPRYGYRRITALLRREKRIINKKRVHRIWKLEGLALRARRPKKRRSGYKGEPIFKAERMNHVWTYDFMEDRTERGGKLRILNVVDEYTRECLAIRVERSINSVKVIDTLKWLFLVYGHPEHLRSDNGPEFIANAIQEWLEKTGCRTIYIKPGSPWENPYIESFNGKFRDECLNREIFWNGREAQMVTENWRREYNEERPHSSLGYLTPSEFAQRPNKLTLQAEKKPKKAEKKPKKKELILSL